MPQKHQPKHTRNWDSRPHEATIAFLPPDVLAIDMHKTFYQWESPANVTVPFQ